MGQWVDQIPPDDSVQGKILPLHLMGRRKRTYWIAYLALGVISLPPIMEKKNQQETTGETIRESHLRSLLKGLTWRVLATATTVCVAYFILKGRENAVQEALSIGLVEFFAKLGIYYLHERAWQKVPIGTVRKVAGLKK